jgi:hypothetical protein
LLAHKPVLFIRQSAILPTVLGRDLSLQQMRDTCVSKIILNMGMPVMEQTCQEARTEHRLLSVPRGGPCIICSSRRHGTPCANARMRAAKWTTNVGYRAGLGGLGPHQGPSELKATERVARAFDVSEAIGCNMKVVDVCWQVLDWPNGEKQVRGTGLNGRSDFEFPQFRLIVHSCSVTQAAPVPFPPIQSLVKD